MENLQLTVSDFVALVNQTLEYAYPTVTIVGEVAEFRVSQGKWVSFKLKDDESVIDCFMAAFNLRIPIENGMKVLIVASPRLNGKWGKFSLNIRAIKPVGEGSIKKGFELLKAKLEAEGLFAPERKRILPRVPSHVAVIPAVVDPPPPALAAGLGGVRPSRHAPWSAGLSAASPPGLPGQPGWPG